MIEPGLTEHPWGLVEVTDWTEQGSAEGMDEPSRLTGVIHIDQEYFHNLELGEKGQHYDQSKCGSGTNETRRLHKTAPYCALAASVGE